MTTAAEPNDYRTGIEIDPAKHDPITRVGGIFLRTSEISGTRTMLEHDLRSLKTDRRPSDDTIRVYVKSARLPAIEALIGTIIAALAAEQDALTAEAATLFKDHQGEA